MGVGPPGMCDVTWAARAGDTRCLHVLRGTLSRGAPIVWLAFTARLHWRPLQGCSWPISWKRSSRAVTRRSGPHVLTHPFNRLTLHIIVTFSGSDLCEYYEPVGDFKHWTYPLPSIGWAIQPPSIGWGASDAPCLTREWLTAARRATRRSKGLYETVLRCPLNFQNEVTCQVKVRSKVKIGGFQVTERRGLKISSFEPILSPNTPKSWKKELIELLFDNKLRSKLISGQIRVTKVTILKTHIRGVVHLLWTILHVEYDVDGLITINSSIFGWI